MLSFLDCSVKWTNIFNVMILVYSTPDEKPSMRVIVFRSIQLTPPRADSTFLFFILAWNLTLLNWDGEVDTWHIVCAQHPWSFLNHLRSPHALQRGGSVGFSCYCPRWSRPSSHAQHLSPVFPGRQLCASRCISSQWEVKLKWNRGEAAERIGCMEHTPLTIIHKIAAWSTVSAWTLAPVKVAASPV